MSGRTFSSAVKFSPFDCCQFYQIIHIIVTSGAALVQKILSLGFTQSRKERKFQANKTFGAFQASVKKEGGEACKSHTAPLFRSCPELQEPEVCICCSESSFALAVELISKE